MAVPRFPILSSPSNMTPQGWAIEVGGHCSIIVENLNRKRTDSIREVRCMKCWNSLDWGWHILMRMPGPKECSCDSIAGLEPPRCLHAFHQDGWHVFRGGFWNHFSIGMDAQVSNAFRSERKLHLENFKNQLTNQGGGTWRLSIC